MHCEVYDKLNGRLSMQVPGILELGQAIYSEGFYAFKKKKQLLP